MNPLIGNTLFSLFLSEVFLALFVSSLVKDHGTLSACIQFPDRQLDTVAQGPGDVDLECRRSPPPQLPSHPYS